MKTHNINTWAMDAMGWSREALPAACTVTQHNMASTPMTLEERIAASMEYRATRLDKTRKAANCCKECGADYIHTKSCSAGLCWVCTVTERRGYMANYAMSVCIHPVCQDKRDDGSLFCEFHGMHNRESKINEPCSSCGVAERVITESYRIDSYCMDCGPMLRNRYSTRRKST